MYERNWKILKKHDNPHLQFHHAVESDGQKAKAETV